MFELIPADEQNPLYNNEKLWSQWSQLHTNSGMVHLRKAKFLVTSTPPQSRRAETITHCAAISDYDAPAAPMEGFWET